MSDIILFDLDNTLLDTRKLMNHFIKPALQEHLVSQWEQFEEVSNRYWRTLTKPTQFNPQQYLNHLAVSFEAHFPALESIFFTPDFFVDSLFPDTKETLTQLKDQWRLGIYSEGNTEFQHQKLRLTGLAEEFETNLIFITTDKIAPPFLERLPDSTIIEDRLEYIEALAKEIRFQPVWLNRESLTQKTDTFCDTIYTLGELPGVIKSS